MITIVMREKSLTCNQSSAIYQYENNTDKIQCLLPYSYDGVDLKNATITLVFKNESGNGGFIELSKSDALYNGYLQYDNRINSNITQYTGKITVFLKINDYDNEVQFETGETSFTISTTKEMPKNIHSEQLSYFDQWSIKMNQVLNTTLKIQRDMINQANIMRTELDTLKKQIGGENLGN